MQHPNLFHTTVIQAKQEKSTFKKNKKSNNKYTQQQQNCKQECVDLTLPHPSAHLSETPVVMATLALFRADWHLVCSSVAVCSVFLVLAENSIPPRIFSPNRPDRGWQPCCTVSLCAQLLAKATPSQDHRRRNS